MPFLGKGDNLIDLVNKPKWKRFKINWLTLGFEPQSGLEHM